NSYRLLIMLTAPEVRKISIVQAYSCIESKRTSFYKRLNINGLRRTLRFAPIGNLLAHYPSDIDCGKVKPRGSSQGAFPHEREIQSYSTAGWCNSGFQLRLRHQELCQEAE